MAVMKTIEIFADSSSSWQDAAEKAVAEAAKSVKNIKSAWVKDQSCMVENGKITTYRVKTKITFQVDT